MNETVSSKRETILSAAFTAFSNYGFQRTSMEDIAKGAGVSRPALYQVFANKGEIFRALLKDGLAESLHAMRECLTNDGELQERITQAFEAGLVSQHRMISDMPHGHEIFDLKNELAADIIEDWTSEVRIVFRQAFQAETSDNTKAEDFAALVEHAISGIKSRDLEPDAMSREFLSVARSIGAAFR